MQKKKILVIRLSSIGDVVLTTTAVRCLKQQLPDVEIHFLIKKKYATILQNNPNIDLLLEFDNNLSEIADRVRIENYSYVIDLQNSLRTSLLEKKTGLRFKKFRKLNFRKYLLVNWKLNLMPRMHVVDRYMETVLFLGVVNDNKGSDFFIADSERFDVGQLPDSFRKNGYIAFVNGAAHNTKKIPINKAKEIIDYMGHNTILLGGQEDIESGEELVRICSTQVINLCGKLSLHGSASVIEQSKVVITPDTGLMHIAAALRKPVVSIWGNTVPAFGMYPYAPENKENISIIEVDGLDCRPCSKIGFNRCPMLHFNCMNRIKPETVYQAVKKYL